MTAQLSKVSHFFGGVWWRLCVRVAVVGALAGAVNMMLVFHGPHATSVTDFASGDGGRIALVLALYVLFLSVPFVPGAEIGLALLVGFGAAMALPVYLATVVALSIAFTAGRLASQFKNHQASRALDPTFDALAGFRERLTDRRWLQRVLRFRCLAVVILINMPGNTIIGGGGGIAMALGYSRALSYPAFLACSAVAVAPVPAMVLLAEHFGLGFGLDLWISTLGGMPSGTAAYQ